MENTKIQEQPTINNHEALLRALYWIWDAFERVNMPYFLVYQTAEDAIAQRDLRGDKVEIGVRRVEWTSGGRRILDAFVKPLFEDGNIAQYEFENVPVIIHVYDDHECIIATDMVRYRYEEFKIPNPYAVFLEVFGQKPNPPEKPSTPHEESTDNIPS